MIAVITPTLPDRIGLLNEAMESVKAQTLQPDFHLVGRDYAGKKPRGNMTTIRNALAEAAGTLGCDYLLFLDDDDLIDPGHLETLHELIQEADIAYSWAREPGRADRKDINLPFDPELAQKQNYLNANFLIRAEVFQNLGGFKNIPNNDWDFWKRLIEQGYRVKCSEIITWTYRRSDRR